MTKQQVNHHHRQPAHQNIGHELARRIEQAYAIPIGNLDRSEEA